jgi:hypothetical protein
VDRPSAILRAGAVSTQIGGYHFATTANDEDDQLGEMSDEERYTAPTLFLTRKDARWLSLRQAEIISDARKPPGPPDSPRPKPIFEDYSKTWMAHRDLKGPHARALRLSATKTRTHR